MSIYISISHFFIKAPLCFLPFTLHQIGWNPDKHWGCERWRGALTLHHPSPSDCARNWNGNLTCSVGGAETTFLCPTDFTDLHRFSVSASGWRVGEGWWRATITLHLCKFLSYRYLCPFGEGWRVFLKVAYYSEVSYMVGFSSPSYFTKCFQKQFGMKPAEFAEMG